MFQRFSLGWIQRFHSYYFIHYVIHKTEQKWSSALMEQMGIFKHK